MTDDQDDGFEPLAGFINEISRQGISRLEALELANIVVTGDRARLKSTGETWLWSKRRPAAGNFVVNSDFDVLAPDFGAVWASPSSRGPESWAALVDNPDILIESGPAWAYLEREAGVARPQPQIAGQAATAALYSPTASEDIALRRRGPKPQYEWNVFHDALMERIFDNDGLFETQAEDERWAVEWFESRYGKAPSESEIRKHVKEGRDRYVDLQHVKRRDN